MKDMRTSIQLSLLLSLVAFCISPLFGQSQARSVTAAAEMAVADNLGLPNAESPASAANLQKEDSNPATKIKKGSGGKEDSGVHHENAQDESKPMVINFEFYFYGMRPGRLTPPDVKGLPKAVDAANDKMGQALAAPFKGTASLTLNPDGSYNFAGMCPALFSDNSYTEFALAVGLKSSEGSLILFPVSGSLRYGKYWNKQGTDKTLRDNWKAFAKAHDWRYVFKYQDVVEPQQQNAAASGQNSSSGSSGVDVGSVLNDVSTGLEIFTAILAIF